MKPRKTPNGRWRADLKSGRIHVATRTFDTKREAETWLRREKAALDGGIDPRSGRERVRDLIPRWLEVRKATVARKTYKSDTDVQRITPTALQALQVSAVSEREVTRVFEKMRAQGRAESSVVRYRASLSSFFAWCVREKMIAVNPVTNAKVPPSSEEATEMVPFSEEELEEAYLGWRAQNTRLADVMLVLGWTGLRWAEARSITVGDVMEVPRPGLLVRHSAPEGVERKKTKGRRSRRVPIADRVLPIVLGFTDGKASTDLLFTTERGARLHRTSVLRALKWEKTGKGRRIHDLRHTAACLWLSRGVNAGTVQAWMGHESIATTNRYLHYLGSDADSAGLDRLNAPRGRAGGAQDDREAE
jgi:integrase